MKLRPPAYPLVNVDPYFNLWLMTDDATLDDTRHWTSARNALLGTVTVDGENYRFFGLGKERALRQTSVDVDALTTTSVFEGAGVELTAAFTTALLPERFEVFARPVTYLAVTARPTDGKAHDVAVRVAMSEEFVLDKPGDAPVLFETVDLGGIGCTRIGSAEQRKLTRSGDDLRIEWGYLYIAAEGGEPSAFVSGGQRFASVTAAVREDAPTVFALAYDDIDALVYYGTPVKAWWRRSGARIEDVIAAALGDYAALRPECDAFAASLRADCERAGGEQYADLCVLAYRQSIGAHKLAADPDGELLFVSKECNSNGCAATVDVSYPSIPLYLRYRPELVLGMMRPVLRHANSEAWPFDFAPHDAGQYPLVNGNVYGGNKITDQMPVEECGNLLLMAAAASKAIGNVDFCRPHMPLFAKWVRYLEQYGADPAEQLCTDDFAGHLAHNCNLSIKAIMGIAAYGRLLDLCGEDGAAYLAEAREMAVSWLERAANGDGTYRLAFDKPGGFSLKYNAVWDKWLGLGVFPAGVFEPVVASYIARQNRYGVVLDNRADYTKSDWIVWAASLSDDPAKFAALIAPLWASVNETGDRVPLTDWYDTLDARHYYFRNRTVVGGLFMKALLG